MMIWTSTWTVMIFTLPRKPSETPFHKSVGIIGGKRGVPFFSCRGFLCCCDLTLCRGGCRACWVPTNSRMYRDSILGGKICKLCRQHARHQMSRSDSTVAAEKRNQNGIILVGFIVKGSKWAVSWVTVFCLDTRNNGYNNFQLLCIHVYSYILSVKKQLANHNIRIELWFDRNITENKLLISFMRIACASLNRQQLPIITYTDYLSTTLQRHDFHAPLHS